LIEAEGDIPLLSVLIIGEPAFGTKNPPLKGGFFVSIGASWDT
jgi:hypothetical protein